ncbi:hypothetical protein NUU61_009188 [Penicillium alfredii]|uniref:Major facilitator superfamily (MFS) profile domain-containing protein n=1 Tax=Penicillium alfredii TaxID=1506179 RepID=A0A9W9EMV3_9EURO|nr:uncharacterized protein NUU61_009188 [Penicillium alfredii]KAJ5084609.1 hypothetical protein NUU61_009188 [Penicillium alfredii]
MREKPSSIKSTQSSKMPQETKVLSSTCEISSVQTTSPSLAADAPKENAEVQSEAVKDKEREYITGTKLAMVIVAVTLVCFLVLLDTSIIVTAIPSITTQFHSLQDLGWYGSSYQIASAALQPLTGRVYTNFKTKWTFLTFFFIFELGSLLCGLANSSKMLIIARAVAGLGSSGLMNGSITILTSSVPLHKSPPLIGVLMGFSQMGVLLGPLLGGAFTEYSTWRWCFYINLPIGAVVAALLVFIHVPEQTAKPSGISTLTIIRHKLDLLGFALFAPAAIQLLLALEYGGKQYAWNSPTVIGLFCGAAATFIVFLLWEHRQGDEAMIPLSMVSKRPVWSSCLMMWTIFAMMLSASYCLPIYFQSIKNETPMMSGVYLLPSILSQLALAVISGALIGKLGYYLPWGVACGVIAAIANGLISTWTPHTSPATLIGYQILLGAGRGAGFQTPLIAIQNTLPTTQISIAMSILMFSQNFSGAMFLTFTDVILDNGLKSLVPKYAPHANAQAIIAAGATGFRSVVAGRDLAGVLQAYSKSINHVFYMAAALGVCCLIFASGMGWKDVRMKKPAAGQV